MKPENLRPGITVEDEGQLLHVMDIREHIIARPIAKRSGPPRRIGFDRVNGLREVEPEEVAQFMKDLAQERRRMRPNPRVRPEEEIQEQADLGLEAPEGTYERGVADALMWVIGEGPAPIPPLDDEPPME